MNHRPQIRHHLTLIALFLLVGLTLFPSIIAAQETPTPQGTQFEISGVVSQIDSGTITVAGITVDVSGITLDANITVGTTVTVTGQLLSTNVVVAQVIIIVNPGATATATAPGTVQPTLEVTPSTTPTPNPNVIIVIEGPVINIVTNIITIYDFDIEVEPAHPLLNIIEIGDIIHIEGSFGNTGVIVATVVSNVSTTTTVTTGVTVSLDGPVEAINGNIITVNGIPVQLAPDDPRLGSLQVGNFISVQGNFANNGTTIILVVVNITIINNVVVDGNPYCWFHAMGMGGGHWHCDGMGMGMGMGDGMGMGMGG